MFQRRHLLVAGAAATFAVLLIAGVVAALVGPSRHRPQTAPTATAAAPVLSPPHTSGWTPVPPATDAPAETAVQQQYDQALASGLAASSSLQAAEAAQVPGPGFSASWPALPAANTPEQWVSEFTRELLDIDFAHQPRAGLGRWLSAEEAPELLPGVPASVANKVLYLSLFDTAALGGDTSPLPGASTWSANAGGGVRWHVSHLLIQADPQFSRIVASGWQPVDERFAVEDVSGLLTTTGANTNTTRQFSMTVYVGSAHWHHGYGTVLVDNWKET